MTQQELIEVTDLLIDIGPEGRRPVLAADAVAACRAAGDRVAERLVSQIPTVDGNLDPVAVDRLLVAVHGEIQRLSEEFRHGARMSALVRPTLAALAEQGLNGPHRIIDIGCGTGYVIRWLAAQGDLGDVDLVGMDLNPSLVAAAAKAASAEDLDCRFVSGDALAPQGEATVLISTGVLHHFRGAALEQFFAAHASTGASAFVHIDFQPSAIAGLGAWMFHRTRMRLATSRHDGIRSAQRAHPRSDLQPAVAAGAPDFSVYQSGRKVRWTPFPCVLTTLIGVRRGMEADLMASLGPMARRLEPYA